MSKEERGESSVPSDEPDVTTPDSGPEVRPVDTRLGFFPYRAAFQRPGLLLRAVLVLYLPVYLLGLLAIVPVQLTGDSMVVNGSLDVLGLSPSWLVVGGVLLLVGVLAMVLAHGAATLIGVAENVRLVSRADPDAEETVRQPAVTIRAAIEAAARRLPTLLVLWSLGALGVAVLLAGVIAATFTDTWIGIPIAVACLVAWLAFSPFAVAWPVALAERRGPFGALRRSVQLTHERRFRLGLTVLFFGYAIPCGLSYGITRIPDLFGRWLAPWPAATLVAVLGWALTVAAVAVLASVQVAVLFSDKTVADLQAAGDDDGRNRVPVRWEWYSLDRDRVLGVLGERPLEWRWVATRRWDAGLRVVAGLLVPGLLATGLIWVNPAGVPAYAAADLSSSTSNLRNQLVPKPDGSVVVVTEVSDSTYIGRCIDDHCNRSLHGDEPDLSLGGVAAGPAGGNRIALSGWRADVDADGVDPDAGSVLRFLTCRPAECDSDAADRAPVLDKYHDGLDNLDTRVALAPDGEGGYLVASLVEYGDLAVYHCADERCADPTKTVLAKSWLTLIPSDSELLDVAVADGKVAVVVTDTNTGEIRQYSCTDLDCTEPRKTVLAPPKRVHSELETQYRAGTQVAFNGAGVPVLAYRDLLTGTVELMACAELACQQRSTYQLTQQGWGHPWPALTVDHTGRPLVATYDLAAEQLLLVACRSDSCDQRATVRLARWEEGPGNTALAVDRANRPVVLHNDVAAIKSLFDYGTAQVYHCDRPGCGAR